MFRPIFCPRMSWRTTWEIGWSELAIGSMVPASGLGGIALGAWILRRTGAPTDHILRRSVAFFLIKSSVNFVAVAVVGIVMALGLSSSDQPLWRTALPAVMSIALIAGVLTIGRLGDVPDPPPDASRVRRGWVLARRALVGGVREAVELVRQRNLVLLVGAVGYWAWDNAVLWATFEAIGNAPPIDVILMGYLIGQLGGLLPIPGGVGGVDGGLIGTLIVYGAPAAEAAAAVLLYRLIVFWLPLLIGAVAFWSLQRELREQRALLAAR
jgi:uncharacterized membrane protein YbhN (UPF0104 family)